MNIFSVKAFSFNDDRLCRDGTVGIYSQDLGFFKTLKKAEAMVKNFVELDSASINPTHRAYFEIQEHKLDQMLNHQTYGICDWESIRTYDSDGNPYVEQLLDADCFKEFDGRETPAKFKHGDIVLHIGHRSAKLMIVGIPPYTKDEWKAKFRPGVKGDWTDDCYLAYDIKGEHDHPFTPYVFPCPFKLSKRIISKLNEVLNENSPA